MVQARAGIEQTASIHREIQPYRTPVSRPLDIENGSCVDGMREDAVLEKLAVPEAKRSLAYAVLAICASP
jgi:hypothetical protein